MRPSHLAPLAAVLVGLSACEPAQDGPPQDWGWDTADTAESADTAGGPGPADPCLAGGALASWSFEEGRGTVAVDGTGNGREGTLEGGSWTGEGAVGGGLYLDGASSVAVDYASDWPTTALTVMGWARPAMLRGYNVLFAHGSVEGIINPFHLGFKEGTPLWTTDLDTLGPALHDEAATASAVGTWYHLLGTWDGVTGERVLYVDGVLLLSDLDGPAALAYDDIPSRVGADVNADELTGFFVGDVDEVAIFDCVVGAAGALEVYSGG